MAEGIGFALGVAIAAILVTVFAAKRIVRKRPAASSGAQVARAMLAFPAVATGLFVLATIWTIYVAPDPGGHDGVTGMVVFAMVFFLFYALVIGAIVSLPAAILAVRSARAGG